jgi:cation diffusion facilitator family transporter
VTTPSGDFELPRDKAVLFKRAIKLEWITIAYLISAVVGIYLTLGASQAMKTAWVEDMLSLIPPIAFLIASRVRHRAPNERYPYGYHRAVTIGFLCAAVALFFMGTLLLFDAIMALISFEHPSIGVVQLFGHQIWLGWLMLIALVWSAVPAFILGRMKIPLAQATHDKVLFGDAKMNKADWLTASAAMAGVIGIGLGLWWADGVAAAVISLDIMHDGYRNLRAVIADLMDARPRLVDDSQKDPTPERVRTELLKMGWVKDAKVRLREEGHVFAGEVLVIPSSDAGLVEKIEQARQMVKDLDWRLHDVVIAPVKRLDEEPPD